MTIAAESHDHPIKGIGFLLAGVFVFSIQDVIIKWISGNYPVHQIVFIRSIFAVIPILIIAHFEGGFHVLRTHHRALHFIRSLLMFTSYTCFYLSIAVLPLAETVTLFFASPLFITILAVIVLNEKVGLGGWLALLIGFGGVIVMLKPDDRMINPAGFLALLAAFFYATCSIITRRLGQSESGLSLAFYPTILYIVFSAIAAITLNAGGIAQNSDPHLAFLVREWKFPSHVDLFLLVLTGLIASAGFYFLSQAYRLAQPSTVAPFEYIAVPMSVVWGYVVWQEILEPQSIIGLVLIVGSGLYIFGRKKTFVSKHVLSIFKIKIRR